MSLPSLTAVGTLSKMTTTYTTSGKEITKFQLECSEKNTKGEYENLYLKGEVWENASKFLNQYFKDGDPCIVTGKLVTNVYQKSDGSKVYENKLHFPSVSFLPKAKGQNQGQAQNNYQPKQQHQQNIPEINLDDNSSIPF